MGHGEKNSGHLAAPILESMDIRKVKSAISKSGGSDLESAAECIHVPCEHLRWTTRAIVDA
jgi:hypothetical protein